MKHIPLNVELENADGQMCVMGYRLREPYSSDYPLRGQRRQIAGRWVAWVASSWREDDPDIIGLWADREQSIEERLEILKGYLEGKEVESQTADGSWFVFCPLMRRLRFKEIKS